MIKICVICRKKYDGYGNNAAPFTIGRCCDECNTLKVIPYRLKREFGVWGIEHYADGVGLKFIGVKIEKENARLANEM